MDTLSLYYFSEAAKDLHITKTANRLYISQQTLSNHIMRLEQELGVKLLYRKPTLSLTYAGEQVLSFAETITRESNNLKDILSDISMEDRGVIQFGASTLRMSTLLPDILPMFSAKYPNVELRITDERSKGLENLVLNGSLDMAIIVPENENPKLHQTPLMQDQIYLCTADSLLRKYYGNKADSIIERSKKRADLKDFSRLPFSILDNRLGKRIMNCFDEADFSPKTYTTSTFIQISNSICFTGLSASFATKTSLHNCRGAIPENVLCFPLWYHDTPLVQESVLIHHKDRYLCHYSQYFFDLIRSHFKLIETLPLEQLTASRLKEFYPNA